MPGEGLARRFRVWGVLLLGLCAACARPSAAPSPVSQSDPCLIAPPPVVAPDSLSIAYALEPSSGVSAPALIDPSRVVGALVYETLIRVDCSGAIRSVSVDSTTPDLRLIELSAGDDMRDMVDRGVDLLLTEDPDVVRYALTREGLSVHPLPPRRTYAIVSAAAAPADSPDVLLHALRASLASEVVLVPARPASGSWWWSEADGCGLADAEARTSASTPLWRVAYRADDPVARAIAERLVSLASRGSDSLVNRLVSSTVNAAPGRVAAEALHAGDFAQALRERTRAAFIVSVPARPLARCSAAADLATAMPWAITAGMVRDDVITPLIEAGAWAIVRRGAVGLSAEWDGTPRLVFSSAPSRNGTP